MGLADRLEKFDPILKDTYCAYQAMYEALKPEDRQALDAAWQKGYSANVVLNALRAEGIKSSNEAIRRHRQGACKCPRTKS
jgi:hypothetical protein